MRLAIVTETRAMVGGVETYLERVIAGLADRHTIAFWSATSDLGDRGTIALPPGVAAVSTAERPESVMRLRTFAPDVLFMHGLGDPALEAQLLDIAPAVAVQHNYHGTCISGSKTMSWPHVRACDRRFGPACLALYFPRRCGGLNPLTMAQLYAAQTARLATLRRCAAIVTLSGHMREELLRQALPAERVHVIPPFVAGRPVHADEPTSSNAEIRLLFLGRLEPLKGVGRLLDALPLVADALGRRVVLTVVGDGAERRSLEAQARRLEATQPSVSVRFTGWQQGESRDRLLAGSHALVVPSLWPEPFGLVGLEAAVAGVPAVAFDTGGIGDWLKDGVTGCLARAEGARPGALAEAIARCVGDAGEHARLARGAQASATHWTVERHLTSLESVLERAARSAAASGTT